MTFVRFPRLRSNRAIVFLGLIAAGCGRETAPVDPQVTADIAQVVGGPLPHELVLLAKPKGVQAGADAWLFHASGPIALPASVRSGKPKQLPARILTTRIEQLAADHATVKPATPFCQYVEWVKDRHINRMWQMEADGLWYVFMESVADD